MDNQKYKCIGCGIELEHGNECDECFQSRFTTSTSPVRRTGNRKANIVDKATRKFLQGTK